MKRKEIMYKYVCFIIYKGKIQYSLETIQHYKKHSIDEFLKESQISWLEAKKNGWRCEKVQITISQVK